MLQVLTPLSPLPEPPTAIAAPPSVSPPRAIVPSPIELLAAVATEVVAIVAVVVLDVALAVPIFCCNLKELSRY